MNKKTLILILSILGALVIVGVIVGVILISGQNNTQTDSDVSSVLSSSALNESSSPSNLSSSQSVSTSASSSQDTVEENLGTNDQISVNSQDSTVIPPFSNDDLLIAVTNKTHSLVSDKVLQYLAKDPLDPANRELACGGSEKQVHVYMGFNCEYYTAHKYQIEYGLDPDFKDAFVYVFELPSGTFEFKHLFANATYYYRVTAYTNEGTAVKSGTFKTADTMRILKLPGIENVRDVGNWKTDSGKRVKQGLLIRGVELDGAGHKYYKLADYGVADMLDVLKIKTDLDLRAQLSNAQNVLGVEHKVYNMCQYGEIFSNDGKQKIYKIFTDLANPDNYPAYLHCTYGSDRTGTVCFLLLAVLGVSEADCIRDFSMTRAVSRLDPIRDGLENFEGDTLKERTENYLISCGITSSQIQSLRDIFLED